METEETDKAEKVVEALEQLSPGEAASFLGTLYAQRRDFSSAYQSFTHIYEQQDSPFRQSAGLTLAELIVNGFIQLNSKGELDEEKTNACSLFTEGQLIKNKAEGQDIALMQQRAIMAYLWLCKRV